MIVWIIGQPGSGKTTLARGLIGRLRILGRDAVHLEGEFLRELTGNTDYSREGRIRNITAGQRLAARLESDGLWVVASFVSPYREQREAFKACAPVLEVYLHTTAVRGRESLFAVDFDPPTGNYLDIDTTHRTVEDCLETILAGLRERGCPV